MAIDASSNLWIAASAGVNEFDSLGALRSPAAGYTLDSLASVAAVGIDSSNNVWLGGLKSSNGAITYAEIGNPGGQLIFSGSLSSGTVVYPQIAADSSGDTWVVTSGGLYKVPAYGGSGAGLQSTLYQGGGVNSGLYYEAPRGVALDGAGVVWLASTGDGTSTLPASILPLNTSLTDYSSAKPYAASSLSAGPLRVAVDGAGNVWVLLSDNTVTEYVGVATPVVTPIALGQKNKKLATKP